MTSRKEAKRWEEEKIASLRGEDSTRRVFEKIQERLVAKNMSFQEAFEFFSNYPRAKTPSERTREIHRSCWNDFAAFAAAAGITSVARVTPECAAEYFHRLQTAGRFVGGKTVPLSPGSFNLRLVILKMIFDVLRKGKACLENPFSSVGRMAPHPETREVFTPEELRKLGAFQNHEVFPILITGCFTGLRLSDICHLKWENFSASRKWLTGTQQKTGQPYSIPVLPPLFRFLEQFEPQRREGAYVFPHLAELYDRDQAKISRLFKELLREAGIDHATVKVKGRERKVSVKDIHSLRHTFAYIAGMSGIPLTVVQSLLGHMTPAITRHYMAHATEEDKRRFLENLPDFLTGGTAPALPAPAPALPGPGRNIKERIARLIERVTPENLERVKRRVRKLIG